MVNYRYGTTTSDEDILRADTIREIIERQADTMLAGQNVLPQRPMPNLDIRLSIPNSVYFDIQQLAENAYADAEILEFFDVEGSMLKFANKFVVSYETISRQLENEQIRMSVDQCARTLALAKDMEIFNTVKEAAGLDITATDGWNQDDGDPAGDIAEGLGELIDSNYLSDAEMGRINVFYPAKLYGHLMKPIEVNNILMSFQNWAQREYQVNFYPTKRLEDDALMVVNSPETGMHTTYNGGDVPQSFFKDTEVGQEYTYFSYFRTIIVPEEKGGNDSNRVLELKDVFQS